MPLLALQYLPLKFYGQDLLPTERQYTMYSHANSPMELDFVLRTTEIIQHYTTKK